MEDFISTHGLNAIAILNTDTVNDYPLVCDFKISKISKIHLVIPYVILSIACLLCLYCPTASVTRINPIQVNKSANFSKYKISHTDVKYTDQYVDIYLHPAEKGSKLKIKGQINVSLYRKNLMVNTFVSDIKESITAKTPAVRAHVLNFDRIDVEFNSEQLNLFDSVEITCANRKFTKIFIGFEVFISVISAFYCINYFINVDSFGVIPTFEQHLTLGLIILLVCYTDLFSLFDLYFASYVNIFRKIFSRDLFFSYFIFYTLSIFSYFGREQIDNPHLTIAIPYLILSFSVLLLLALSSTINNRQYAELFPMFSGSNMCFNICHCVMFILYAIYYVVNAILVKAKVKTVDQNRYYNYLTFSVHYIVILDLTIVLGFFIPETSALAFMPAGVFTACSISLIYAHKTVPEKNALYEKAETIDADNEMIGAAEIDETRPIKQPIPDISDHDSSQPAEYVDKEEDINEPL